MIKAIIFDCFGVVVTYGFHAAFTAMGGNLQKDKKMLGDLFGVYNSGKLSDDQLLRRLAQHLGLDAKTVKENLAKDEHLDNQLLKYIEELRQNYKIGLLSNIGRGGAERYFANIDTSRYFDDMVLSGEVGMVKPDPRIFRLAADRLAVELDECVFTDDSERNCAEAQGVGMKAIVYKDFNQFKNDLDKILSSP